MAFKRHLEADLVAWDRCAGEAAMVAQILIMGGALRPDFDTRTFDQRLKRRARTHMKIADGMRIMATALPTLTFIDVGRTSARDFLDPQKMRAEWLRQGVPAGKIGRYLGSKLYANAKLQVESFMGAGLGALPTHLHLMFTAAVRSDNYYRYSGKDRLAQQPDYFALPPSSYTVRPACASLQ